MIKKTLLACVAELRPNRARLQNALEFFGDLIQKGLKGFFVAIKTYGGGERDATSFKSPLPFSGVHLGTGTFGKLYTLELSIAWTPTSLNKTLRSGYRARHRSNNAWDCYIAAECVGIKPPRPLPKAKLSIVRCGHRMLDFDGLVGSLKPVADALVTAGVLLDDRWSVTGAWHVDQEFRAKKLGPLLRIKVEEIA